ncbi:hypothetical protein B0J13DRAFT_215231 [Dactylonectria estremocensis]|uniref:Zn(2)-C6 fungal-type domain-containing protein n=1 Tax=Dactylonectria estremocensis TaxID=1079267 RepID=A0A9P9F6T2_9HYPO|nr:hypothetical protein B0J13DRAFT_215231 [Dactylonectria estremocensis]
MAADGLLGNDPAIRAQPPRKRRRIVISCTECHRRKQRCDRELPCQNCKARDKECIYETGAPTARIHQQQQQQQQQQLPREQQKKLQQQVGKPLRTYSQDSPGGDSDEPLSTRAADWGYGQHVVSTMGFLKQIETANGDNPSPISANNSTSGSPEDDFAVREKYKSLIRQLPARVYIDKLVELYMRGFNWQYYPIDPDIFYQQLDEWDNVPFAVLSTAGPRGLSPNLRVFPAVLFQVIASALLLLPERPDPVFDALKYMGSMKFEDLAVEYSDAGAAILDLLGKKQLALETVQAQFLRATFFKYTARVTEAWHAISVAIRDAQDLGMHKDSLDPEPKDWSANSIVENQWFIQRRRRMYTLLAVWDLNCSTILGRPGTIDWNQTLPTPPVDTSIPTNRSKTPVVPRGETERPSPVTRILWNVELAKPLQAIRNLEMELPNPKDFPKVDQLHQSILDLHDRIPPAFRLDDPDTQWDDEPDMRWLQACRFYFAQLHMFGLMALHRSYVFHRKRSRAEAIQASLRMLEIQKMTFQGLPPDTWRNYLLFFGSFDAIVLIASVYILFPHEHPELTGSVSQHFQWTIERFSAMQERNPLAKAAQGVLRAIVARFKKAISNPADSRSTDTPSTGRKPSTTRSMSRSKSATTGLTPENSASEPREAFEYSQTGPSDMATGRMMPSTDNLAMLAPMFPMGDIIYNDLNAVHDTMALPVVEGGVEGTDGMETNNDVGWLFGGDLDDTVWQMLNQYQQAGEGYGQVGVQ